MKILCLYNNPCALELFEWLQAQGHNTVLHADALSLDDLEAQNFDLAVSYTYKFILTGEMLRLLKDNAVNIHNAFLPWNRGADPNIWSCLDGTPRGVTLHYMDENLDKGAIIAQQLVNDGNGETLRSSYANLDAAAKRLFKDAFRYYEYWPSMRKFPMGKGNYHSLGDGAPIRALIDTYDMPIGELKTRCGAQCFSGNHLDDQKVMGLELSRGPEVQRSRGPEVQRSRVFLQPQKRTSLYRPPCPGGCGLGREA